MARYSKWFAAFALLLGLAGALFIQQRTRQSLHVSSEAERRVLEKRDQLTSLEQLSKNLLTIESTVRSIYITGQPDFQADVESLASQIRGEMIQIRSFFAEKPLKIDLDRLETVVQKRVAFSETAEFLLRTEGQKSARPLFETNRDRPVSMETEAILQRLRAAKQAEIEGEIVRAEALSREVLALQISGGLLASLLAGSAIFFLFYDLRRREKLVSQFHDARNQAERLAESRSQFLANVSHEIRTPLNAILGFGQMLSRSPLDSRQSELVQGIQSSGENLLGLLNDFLDSSKIEAGMLRLESRTFGLREILERVEALFLPKMQEKRLAFRVEITPDTPNLLVGDAMRLTQILANLVGNAVKFTRSGYVFLLAEAIDFQPDSTAVRLRFLVKDTGLGIPKSDQTQIFERFRQVENDGSGRSHFGGTGLGLAIVRDLAELMGGSVFLESTEGYGSTFVVELPFEIGTQIVENQPVTPLETTQNASYFLGKKVLLVEDNPLNQRLATMLLSEWGLLVEVAETGAAALETLQIRSFDLVLMDIQLPDMDGYSTTYRIRTELGLARLPIVALTAQALAGERERCLALGMDDYLAKPLNEVELRQTLSRFFMKKTTQVIENQPVATEKILNLNYLLDLSKGRPAFVREMLDMFCEQAPRELKNLQRAVKIADFGQIKSIAHGMKSSAGYVGMSENGLSVLEKMESLAAKNAPPNELRKQAAAIEKLFEKAVWEAKSAAF